jgi:hypothetical protein
VLLHTLGVALLTLLINASTTGALVRYLGLSKQSDIKKNILVGITYKLDKNVESNIEVLKENRHFSNVDWDILKEDVNLKEIKEKFRRFKNLHIDGNMDHTMVGLKKFDLMDNMNEKINKHAPVGGPDLPANFISAKDTFKSMASKKSLTLPSPVHKEPRYNINNDGSVSDVSSAAGTEQDDEFGHR